MLSHTRRDNDTRRDTDTPTQRRCCRAHISNESVHPQLYAVVVPVVAAMSTHETRERTHSRNSQKGNGAPPAYFAAPLIPSFCHHEGHLHRASYDPLAPPNAIGPAPRCGQVEKASRASWPSGDLRHLLVRSFHGKTRAIPAHGGWHHHYPTSSRGVQANGKATQINSLCHWIALANTPSTRYHHR